MILNKISNDMKISKDKKVLFDVTIINITNILKSKQMFRKYVRFAYWQTYVLAVYW